MNLDEEDERRLKDTIRGKDRMQRWYVHRAFVRMSMEHETQALEADARNMKDLEDRLSDMREVVAENCVNATRAAAQSDARALELTELRQQLAAQQVANTDLTNQLAQSNASFAALHNAATTTPPVATGGVSPS